VTTLTDTPLAMRDSEWMRLAVELARQAERLGEVPVGAVLVRDQQLVGRGLNSPIHRNDPTAHAEILAIRAAGAALGDYRLTGTTLYVTLEPCPMCMSALIHARVSRVVFGAYDPRQGAISSAVDIAQINPLQCAIDTFGGVLMDECASLLRDFFAKKR